MLTAPRVPLRIHGFALLCASLLIFVAAQAQEAPHIEQFSPQGFVKDVRQVAVRFSAPMVSFGDPDAASPFTVECAAVGAGRWVDARHWIYDFDADLPAGLGCTFSLTPDVVSLDGRELTSPREFAFSTGGPSVLHSLPYEGGTIDEEQIFLLGLDAPASRQTIQEHAFCEVDGVGERVAVRVIEGDERRQILSQRNDFLNQYFRQLTRFGRSPLVMYVEGGMLIGTDQERFAALRDSTDSPIVVLQCQRRLPNTVQVALVWGAGIATDAGVLAGETRRLAYRVRDAFRAQFSCSRATADANCTPVLPMTLTFTAPIARADAERIRLIPDGGQRIAPTFSDDDDARLEWIQTAAFPGPFPEGTRFRLQIPRDLHDDAQRALANQDRFPLEVRTEDAPPLIRFPAEFGIIEWHGNGNGNGNGNGCGSGSGSALPVTLRNVEALVPLPQLPAAGVEPARLSDAPDTQRPADELTSAPWYARWYRSFRDRFWPQASDVSGRMLRIDDAGDALRWMARSRELGRVVRHYDPELRAVVTDHLPGELSLFTADDPVQSFTLPKPHGERAFEVIGIPFDRPGFYLVEIASPRLGASLYGKDAPYHARTAVLVTGMAAHFKRGRESSLVWVTQLDSGRPVAGADVTVTDCAGQVYASGVTGVDGLLRVDRELPEDSSLPVCADRSYAFIVSARAGDDFTFALSTWNDGIAPWRFGLSGRAWQTPHLVTTVFDRMLLRAGETVHMKHFARRHSGDGFALVAEALLPDRATVRHQGTLQTYELALQWDASGTSTSEWHIPSDAQQGVYEVLLELPAPWGGVAQARAGTFQVEAFRVPTMTAMLQPVTADPVAPSDVPFDIQLNYLSGGVAGGAPVTLRAAVEPRGVSFADYREFRLGNGNVREGLVDQTSRWAFEETPDDGVQRSVRLPDQSLNLDATGGARVTFDGLPVIDDARELLAELEYRDANGEVATVAQRVALWPADVVAGIRPQGWVATSDRLAVQALALDLSGRPLADTHIEVDVFRRINYSHRQRLVGGFYTWRSQSEVRHVGTLCSGVSDALGLLHCEEAPPAQGNLIVRVTVNDAQGRASHAHAEVWVTDEDRWWFAIGDDDRMDLLPEQRRYEPGEYARLQVRMPFQEATALVTVEREGVLDAFVTTLSGDEPVVELPVRSEHAPNAFVSVLAVRGRIDGIRPDALVDLGRPAYKLGIAEIDVGWLAHELDVRVTADREDYAPRETATATVQVSRADGGPLPAGTEVAFAAVDEGLLELRANDSWRLLDAMMGRRGLEVTTSTAQMHVVGRRHFGKKAVPAGGGGGRQGARELFDTLLLWQPRVMVDENGRAEVEVPLNDSLTAFRLVAVAHAGSGLFGTGVTSIRSTQSLMLLTGLPPMVREGDSYAAMVTVRNASAEPMQAVTVSAQLRMLGSDGAETLPAVELADQITALAAGEARELSWHIDVPDDVQSLAWTFAAAGTDDASDAMTAMQRVIPAVPVRTVQATLEQISGRFDLEVTPPAGALPGRGGLAVTLSPSLASQLDGVREAMSRRLCDRCLEPRISQAVALRDRGHWDALMNDLPVYLDPDGLLRPYPGIHPGEDSLTAYVLAVAHEAGWTIPQASRDRMVSGLLGFAQGRIVRGSALPTADLAIRKIAALAAVARHGPVDPAILTTLDIEPTHWPTSAVLDWIDLLRANERIPQRQTRLETAEQILRARMDLRGTLLGFSTERSDYLWWLMVSPDANANRAILSVLDLPGWQDDLPRMVRGSLARQQRGAWHTGVANAWGVLAMERFAARFESEPVAGTTHSSYGTQMSWQWDAAARTGDAAGEGGEVGERGEAAFEHPWQTGDWQTTGSQAAGSLSLRHEGQGRPWAMVRSRAAVPREQATASGFTITRSVTPVLRQQAGVWQRGDVARVRLEVDAQSDATWVALIDPIPAGATVLGSGLGRDSRLQTADEARRGFVWPAFEERRHESFGAFYRFVPKGQWMVEYTVRFNNAGVFVLPPTRVEAMYAPEMFGELPNTPVTIVGD